ncbi:MAG: hypothetical protein Nkreftii_001196 [Candidatus Nitrospira kreftii]|jgi:hypothetical protein|uniref:Uncharacterized protein n=1 Tax=Candidatus Nitrospira kreftii TaxID=2652173 RepID=A0A7S8IXX0_9BACT|nr:MAG: hypothetical protein Nkreftii_001196 [Candidatus Nitrospira kreftii]
MGGMIGLIPQLLTTLDQLNQTPLIRHILGCYCASKRLEVLTKSSRPNRFSHGHKGLEHTHAKLPDYIEVIQYCKGVDGPPSARQRDGSEFRFSSQ